MKVRRRVLIALAACVMTNFHMGVSAAPITFNTALPVAKDEFVVRVQGMINKSGDDPSAANRERTAQALLAVVGYGVNSKLSMFGVLPYRDNELMLSTNGQETTRAARGLGDVTFFGRYTVHQTDQPGQTFRLAPFAGVKAPTGDYKTSDTMGTLPPGVQVGSGTWDGFVGIVSTYQTLSFQVDGQFSYRVNGEASGFEFGNVTRLDGSLQYRLHPQTLTGGIPGFLYGVVETNLIHRTKDKVNDRTNPNSGGTTIFIAPGVQFVTKRWIVEAAIQVPVLQNLNGTALENDYVGRAGLRFNF